MRKLFSFSNLRFSRKKKESKFILVRDNQGQIDLVKTIEQTIHNSKQPNQNPKNYQAKP